MPISENRTTEIHRSQGPAVTEPLKIIKIIINYFLVYMNSNGCMAVSNLVISLVPY